MFRVNEVVSYDKKRYRILAIHQDVVVWILLDGVKALPCIEKRETLSQAVLAETLLRVDDPYSDITYWRVEEGSTSQIKRDGNFQLIEPIITNPEFFLPKVRGPLINQIVGDGLSTKQTLFRLLRRYWLRGQTANALIPDYKNSGAKGRKREPKNKKLGRPRKYTPGVGALVDEHIERLFRTAIDRYLLTRKKHTFPYAYRKFKSLYTNCYPDIPESEIPSNWQMMHFYKREYSITDSIKKRCSSIDYAKDVRPLISTANTQVMGPGSRYEIDISEEDWPTVGLPDAILADRGELIGYQIEALETAFSVRIENTPPYRGDGKGIVERNFKTLQADFKSYAPGVVSGTTIKKRGGNDYRLDAKLTFQLGHV